MQPDSIDFNNLALGLQHTFRERQFVQVATDTANAVYRGPTVQRSRTPIDMLIYFICVHNQEHIIVIRITTVSPGNVALFSTSSAGGTYDPNAAPRQTLNSASIFLKKIIAPLHGGGCGQPPLKWHCKIKTRCLLRIPVSLFVKSQILMIEKQTCCLFASMRWPEFDAQTLKPRSHGF